MDDRTLADIQFFGLERYGAGHDVSGEKRDESGEWTLQDHATIRQASVTSKVRLNERQTSILKRVVRESAKNEVSKISPDVGQQLLKKGLIERGGHDYKRKEWNKVVATLWVVWATQAGIDAVNALQSTSE